MQRSVSDANERDVGRGPNLLPPLALGGDRFASQVSPASGARTFGGRLVSEALLAASATVDPLFQPHSIHAQFLRPGDAATSQTYAVERLRDGRGFCSRLVRVEQADTLICLAMASFAAPRPGPDRQAMMPEVLPPESLPPESTARASDTARAPLLGRFFWGREHPVEFRPADLPTRLEDADPSLHVWFRAKPAFLSTEDAVGRAALLAYASDRFVMTTASLPYLSRLPGEEFVMASLDHALWMHRDYAPGSWLLYAIEGITASNSRTFVRGQIFAENGDHVASVSQEGVLSLRPRAAAGPP